MNQNLLFEKGYINDNYDKDKIKKIFSNEMINEFFAKINKIAGKIENNSYLEISHENTNSFELMLNNFKEGVFLSDDPFESLLVYHYSKIINKNLNVYNYFFTPKSLSALKLNESFDFIFSLLGISFEQLFLIIPQILGFLKIDGILGLLIPSYWYDRDNLTPIESEIINYSKQNDKKWIFTDKLDPVIEENGGNVIGFEQMPFNININRLDLAYISSLSKLYDSIIKNNIAHLEIVNIPEKDIEIRTTLLTVKKTKKTINKDNLFNL